MNAKKATKDETAPVAPTPEGRGKARSREGIVVSDKMDKTVTISITRQVKHAAYGKYMRKTDTCMAHDEENSCKVGDRVKIVESRPISRWKRWKVESILARAE